MFFDPSKHDPPANFQIATQTVVGLAAIVGGAHIFVTEIEHIATSLGISALVLALLIAPLASKARESQQFDLDALR